VSDVSLKEGEMMWISISVLLNNEILSCIQRATINHLPPTPEEQEEEGEKMTFFTQLTFLIKRVNLSWHILTLSVWHGSLKSMQNCNLHLITNYSSQYI